MCLFKKLVLCAGKNFFKNSLCISCHVPSDLGLKEFSHVLALSFKEKGNKVNLRTSSDTFGTLNVMLISSKSLR